MAHPQQLEFVETLAKHLPGFFRNANVLEIGALDINGSIRQFFDRCHYVGIDVAEGNGVDLVCKGQEYDAPDAAFDHVVSCESMEHNPAWRETFANMIRLCRSGGLVTMTCATTGRGEHGTSKANAEYSPLTIDIGWEYYGNLTEEDFRTSWNFDELFSRYRFWVDWSSFDLYFAGIRSEPRSTVPAPPGWAAFEKQVDETTKRHNRSARSLVYRLVALALGDAGFAICRRVKRRLLPPRRAATATVSRRGAGKGAGCDARRP